MTHLVCDGYGKTKIFLSDCQRKRTWNGWELEERSWRTQQHEGIPEDPVIETQAAQANRHLCLCLLDNELGLGVTCKWSYLQLCMFVYVWDEQHLKGGCRALALLQHKYAAWSHLQRGQSKKRHRAFKQHETEVLRAVVVMMSLKINLQLRLLSPWMHELSKNGTNKKKGRQEGMVWWNETETEDNGSWVTVEGEPGQRKYRMEKHYTGSDSLFTWTFTIWTHARSGFFLMPLIA